MGSGSRADGKKPRKAQHSCFLEPGGCWQLSLVTLWACEGWGWWWLDVGCCAPPTACMSYTDILCFFLGARSISFIYKGSDLSLFFIKYNSIVKK